MTVTIMANGIVDTMAFITNTEKKSENISVTSLKMINL